MTEKTFVFQNIEVKLTGRQATKPRPVAKRRGTGTGQPPQTIQLVEITPADEENGSWKKWVKMDELFEIAPLDPSTIPPDTTIQ